MARILKLLLVEDSPDDAEMLLLNLQKEDFDIQCRRCENAEDLTRALQENTWDIVLADFTLPEFSGPEALKITRAHDPDLSFVIVSGTIGEETAVELVRAGANDYVFKENLQRLGTIVSRELLDQNHRRERRRAEADAFRLAAIVDSSNDAIISISPTGTIQTWNPAAEELFGWSQQEIIGQPMTAILPAELLAAESEYHEQIVQGSEGKKYESQYLRKDGTVFDAQINVFPIIDNNGCVIGISNIIQDITNQKQSEADRERLISIIQYSPDFIGIADDEENVLFINDGGCQLVGLSRPVNGKVVRDFYPEADYQLITTEIRSHLASNDYWTGKLHFRHFQNRDSVIPMRTVVFQIPGKVADRPFIACVAQDISKEEQFSNDLLLRDRAINAVRQGILIADMTKPDHPIIYASPGFVSVTGYRIEDTLGRNCRFLQGPNTDKQTVKQIRNALEKREHLNVEILNYRKDGTSFWNELSLSPVVSPSGECTHFVGVQTDVTERRLLEDQVRQSQKMEAVGLLAGGIAHDFNNLLTIINGYSEILLSEIPASDPKFGLVGEILKAGERSAALTSQMLSFSRKQVIAPRNWDLNEIINSTEKMLSRVIGENIQIVTLLDVEKPIVHVDVSSMEQVLLNLAINARDAMPSGGKIIIRTKKVILSGSDVARRPGLKAGNFVKLTFEDTGCGIPQDLLTRIWEPFFTTKEVGAGTGLGLSAVHGIIRQCDGFAEVQSSENKGTIFSLYIPLVSDGTNSQASKIDSKLEAKGHERILLVEDELAVLTLAERVLAKLGYQVTGCANGEQGVKILRSSDHNRFDLLITDVIMPGIGGRELASFFKKENPEGKVLYISGYTDDTVVREGILFETVDFLQKPYSPSMLTKKVREILDHKPSLA